MHFEKSSHVTYWSLSDGKLKQYTHTFYQRNNYAKFEN